MAALEYKTLSDRLVPSCFRKNTERGTAQVVLLSIRICKLLVMYTCVTLECKYCHVAIDWVYIHKKPSMHEGGFYLQLVTPESGPGAGSVKLYHNRIIVYKQICHGPGG